MEPLERAVLRRKIFLLKATVPLDKRLFDECKRQGLLKDKQITAIKNAQPEYEAYYTLISHLEEQGHVTFDKVCYLLDRTGRTEIADELQAELQLLKKAISSEDHQLEEAKCILRRHFDLEDGNSDGKTHPIDLNDPETQNTVLQLMLDRYLVGKETWVRQYRRKRELINREKRTIGQGLDDVSKEIQGFIDEKAKLVGIPVEWPERRADTPGAGSHQAAFSNLRKRIDTMSGFFDTMLKEQEKMVKERCICFRMLGITDIGTPLNERLENFLSKSYGDLDRTKIALSSKTEMAKHLDSEIYRKQLEMNKKIHIKQLEIETFQRKLVERDAKVKEMQKELSSVRHSDDIAKAQVDYWKERCTALEKTRRLGYYNFDYKHTKGKSIEELKEMAGNTFNGGDQKSFKPPRIPGLSVSDSLNTMTTTDTSVWDSGVNTITPMSQRSMPSSTGRSSKQVNSLNNKNMFMSSASSTPTDAAKKRAKFDRPNKGQSPRPASKSSTKSENSIPMSGRSSLESKSLASELNLSFNDN